MKLTAFEGVVENGKIKLIDSVRLPEKAKVFVVLPDREARADFFVGSPRLAHPEQAKDFLKEVVEEPEDGKVQQ